METFNPFDWFWSVDSKPDLYWSTKEGTYVSSYDGNRLSNIDTEQTLTNFLKNYGLPGPTIEIPSLQPYQFFAVLELSGKKDALYDFINNLPIPNNVVAKAKLEHTLSFNRNDPLVLSAQQALGLSEQELDNLWAQALTL